MILYISTIMASLYYSSCGQGTLIDFSGKQVAVVFSSVGDQVQELSEI